MNKAEQKERTTKTWSLKNHCNLLGKKKMIAVCISQFIQSALSFFCLFHLAWKKRVILDMDYKAMSIYFKLRTVSILVGFSELKCKSQEDKGRI